MEGNGLAMRRSIASHRKFTLHEGNNVGKFPRVSGVEHLLAEKEVLGGIPCRTSRPNVTFCSSL